MIVYRLEHEVGSEDLHGPQWGSCDSCRDVETRFGANGTPAYGIEHYERCAVTVDQYEQWWDPGVDIELESARLNDGGWRFGVYDTDRARELYGQVVFDYKSATRVKSLTMMAMYALAKEARNGGNT